MILSNHSCPFLTQIMLVVPDTVRIPDIRLNSKYKNLYFSTTYKHFWSLFYSYFIFILIEKVLIKVCSDHVFSLKKGRFLWSPIFSYFIFLLLYTLSMNNEYAFLPVQFKFFALSAQFSFIFLLQFFGLSSTVLQYFSGISTDF